jgi:hypothetical protein
VFARDMSALSRFASGILPLGLGDNSSWDKLGTRPVEGLKVAFGCPMGDTDDRL